MKPLLLAPNDNAFFFFGSHCHFLVPDSGLQRGVTGVGILQNNARLGVWAVKHLRRENEIPKLRE